MVEGTVAIGSIREFNPEVNEWDIYKKQINHFFTANGISDAEIKRAILLANLSESAYKLLTNLCIPVDPDTKKYQELLHVLDEHFTPKKSGFAERQKFYAASKDTEESLAEWVARVQALAVNCKFGTELQVAMRDKFIMGMEKGPIKDKLFLEDCESLTLNRAREIAENLEAVRSHFEQIQVKRETEVFELQQRKVGAGNSSSKPNSAAKWRTTGPSDDKKGKVKCFVCGYTNHLANKCKYRNKCCDICGVKGHLKVMCKGINLQKGLKVKTNKFLDTFEQHIYNMEGNGLEPIFVKVEINNQIVQMQIDSGAAVSVVSEKMYRDKFKKSCLKKTNTHLITYDKSEIKPVGVFNSKIKYNGKTGSMDIYVIKNGGPPLVGRDFMEKFKLGIREVNAVNVVQEQENFMFSQFKTLFSPGMGKFLGGKIKLDVQKEIKPKFFKPFSVPFSIRGKIERELDRLEKENIISRVNFSNWGTPIVPVIKKDGNVRICGNYKVTVNQFLHIDRHVLPKVEEIFLKLQGGEEFSKIDLSHAYNQCEITEDSKEYTTISTHKGLYVYNRLPFGLSTAPSKFAKIMDAVLMGLKGTANYMDDIVVTGRSREEHKKNLIAVLARLEAFGFKLKAEKCELFKKSIAYLGYIIDKKGLRSDPEKLKAILEAPRPTEVSKLKSFLGMVNYYRRFIENISTLLSPLYRLLKKDVDFKWSEDAEEAFLKIKRKLASNEVLVHYNPNVPLVLTVDASNYGIGAVLAHRYSNIGEKRERPIAYASRRLTDAETRYSTINKEALAIIFGVTKFHDYLYGRNFTLVTDHKPLLNIFGPKVGIPRMAANRLQRYAVFLSGYSFNMEYTSSDKNQADGLSRLPIADENFGDDHEIGNILLNYVENNEGKYNLDTKNIKIETNKDKVLSEVIRFIKSDWPKQIPEELKSFYEKKDELNIEEDCLFWGYRIILPLKLRKVFLNELHSSHMGIVKMKSMARAYVWWPSLNKEIEKVAKSCLSCARNKPNPEKSVLMPWKWPEKPWERVHIDFMGPLYGKYFLIVIDAHSKWLEAIETNNIKSGETIKQLRNIFSRFGLPKVIVSDNATNFKSAEFETFCLKNNIKHVTSPPFHPATNGAAENSVKSVKNGIKNAISSQSKTYDLNLIINNFLMHYRNSVHCTTGETPAKLMLNRNVRTKLSMVNPKLECKKEKNSIVKEKVKKKQDNQIKNHKGREQGTLNVNDIVLAKDYRDVNKPKWSVAKIVQILGIRTYLVQLQNSNVTWKRHINQIRTDIYMKNRGNDFDSLVYDYDTNSKSIEEGINKESDEVPEIVSRDEESEKEEEIVRNSENNVNDKVNNQESMEIRNRRNTKKPDRLHYYRK